MCPWLCIPTIFIGLVSVSAAAQEPVPVQQTHGITVFDVATFADAAPANAHDMVVRLPGFGIIKADVDVRGYAGARGNVLIDGVQPTSRREDIISLLKRIPAASVDRIELIRGGAPGIDMGEHAVLANVVRGHAITRDRALQAGVAIATDGWSGPQGQFEYERRHDDRVLEFVLSAERALSIWNDRVGTGRIRGFTSDRILTEDLDTDNHRARDLYGSSVHWRQALYGGSFSFNAALRGERADGTLSRFGHGTDALVELQSDGEDSREFEAGSRYLRPIGGRSQLELVASQRLGRTDTQSLSQAGEGENRFEESRDSGETLLRLNLERESTARLRLSAGLEGAFNFIESQNRMREDGVPVEMPGSNVRVEERRAQSTLGATWQPRPTWTVESALRVETSTLSQSGDMPTERDFVYFKPRLAAYWKRDHKHRFHASLAREVGQLDFRDFVASAALDKGLVSAGNAELEPDKTWRLVAGWERSFREDSALGMAWMHERIADVVDRVLVVSGGDRFDAPGNIGEGRRDTLQVELSDSLGTRGFRFSSRIQWRVRSEVVDPTTGQTRRISDEAPLEGRVDLMQALPDRRMSWGIGADLGKRQRTYSYNEIGYEYQALTWTLYAEKWLGQHWRVRMEASDLFGLKYTEERSRYAGPRSSMPIARYQTLSHRTPGQMLLTVRRSWKD